MRLSSPAWLSLALAALLALATLGGATLGLAQAPEDVARKLYSRFRDARDALSAEGPSAVVKYYSAAMMENALVRALRQSEAENQTYNRERDVLWEEFSDLGDIAAVHDYAVVGGRNGEPALQLHITRARCQDPATFTLEFAMERGELRVSGIRVSTTDESTRWWSRSAPTIERFREFRGIDRSDAFKESSAILGIKEASRPCPKRRR